MQYFQKILKKPFTKPKFSLFWLVFCILILSSFTSHQSKIQAAAGINQQINFQARLLNAQGATVPDGNYNIQFKIYRDGDGDKNTADETLLWTEEWLNQAGNGVTVKNGYLSAYLGKISSLAGVDFNNDTLWLSLNVGNTNVTCTPFSGCSGDGEMNPYKRFASNPYALNSGRLGGLTSTQFVQLAQGVQADSSTANASIAINKTGGTANILDLQRASASVALIDNNGTTTLQGTGNSSSLLVKQTANGTPTADIFNVLGANGTTKFLSVVSTAANQGSITVQSVGGSNALTLTSAGAATWSTTTGTLTLQGGSGTVSLGSSISLTASGALTVSSGGTGGLSLDSASGTITIASGDAISSSGNISTTGTVTGGSFSLASQNISAWNQIPVARIGSSTYSTLQHAVNLYNSPGWLSGGAITDAGTGNVSVAAGTGTIRATDSDTAELRFFDWSSATINIPSGTKRYVGVIYNAGSPIVTAKVSDTWDYDTEWPLGVVINNGAGLSIENNPMAVGDSMTNVIERFYGTSPHERDERQGGLILGETGTRNLTVSAGKLWDRLNEFDISAINTSTGGVFDRYYRDGAGGYVKETGQTQWDNTKYDNGSGTLATMTAGYFANKWYYVTTENKLVAVYGQAQYSSQALAQDEDPPSQIPDRLVAFGKLIGRIVYVKDAATASRVESAFTSAFTGSVVTNHSSLAGLAADDHTQYALLAGRSGGQTLFGGTVANDSLILQSTSNVTKGNIILNGSGGLVGIGTSGTISALLSIGGTTGNLTVDTSGNLVTAGDIAVNGGDITSTASLTVDLVNASAATTLSVTNSNAAQVANLTVEGSISGVGVAAGTGLIQGAGGLTVTGAVVNLNASSNFATNINTGTSTGAVAIGNSATSGFTLESGTGTTSLFDGATAHTINFATGAAAQSVTMGSTNTTSSVTIQGGTGGINLLPGGSSNTGVTIRPTVANSTELFRIRNLANDANLFIADGVNSRIGINTANSSPQAGLDIGNGGMRIAGSQTAFTTPVGSTVSTYINIPLADPGNFGQLLAFGLPSTASTSARGISIFDARTVAHQPTIGVFNPSENDMLGFSWDGSNTTGYLKSLGSNIGIRSNTTDVATFLNNGNTSLAGDLEVVGADITTTSTGTATLFNTNAVTLNIGGAATAAGGGINLAGGSGSTGCSIDGSNGNLTCSGAIVGSNSNLQGAYNADVDSGDAAIVLTSADGGLLFQNPSSGGIASGAALKIDQLATGAIEGLRIESAGTGNLLTIRDTTATAADVLTIVDGGAATFRNQTDSTTAFQIQNTTGVSLLTVDTATNNINLLGNNSGALPTSWTANGSSGMVNRREHGSVVANGYVYVIGGSSGGGISPTNTAYYAKANADGSLGNWSTTSTLPATRADGRAVYANGYIYYIGGEDGSQVVQSSVYYAKVNSDGTLGTWGTSNATGLGARSAHTVAVINGYIYVMGGETTAGGSGTTTTYYAKLNADGSVSNWNTTATLAANRTRAASVVANGYIYIIGGSTGAARVDTIYYAKPALNGTISAWTDQASNKLPAATDMLSAVVANGYIYAIGGKTSTATEDDVYYAPFNADGSTGAWTASTVLPGAREQGAAVVSNGYIYQLAGSTGAALQSTVYYISTSRLKIGGSLDLVGYSGENLSEGGTGGSLTAGNTNIVGTLQVQDMASFMQGVSIDKELSVGGSVLFRNATDSTNALQIQNAASSALLVADTTAMLVKIGTSSAGTLANVDLIVGEAEVTTTLRIGTSTNGMDFSGSGATYYGAGANVSRRIALSPEYPGATLSADGANNTGTMTSDNEGSTNNWRNYYNWSSLAVTNQDYDIITRVVLPPDFGSWETGSCPGATCALEVEYKTGLAATTNNGVSALIYNATSGTSVCTLSEVASTTWSSFGCTSATLDDGVGVDLDAAGQVAIIRITLKANSTASALARSGDIVLRYRAKY